MTKFQLFNLLAAEYTMIHDFVSSGQFHYRGILRSIEREDGSGSSFNVTIDTGNGNGATFHIRTID